MFIEPILILKDYQIIKIVRNPYIIEMRIFFSNRRLFSSKLSGKITRINSKFVSLTYYLTISKNPFE